MDQLNAHTNSFCESYILGSCPEYLNTISSLAFCYVAIVSILGTSWHYNNNYYILYHSLMIILGISSASYHYYCTVISRLADETTMMILTALILINLYNTSYKVPKLLYTLLILMYYILAIICNAILLNRSIFVVIYGFPIFIGIIFHVLILYCRLNNTHFIWLAADAVLLMTIGFILWIIVEIFCHNNIVLLLFHPLWHILMAYGVHNIFQYTYYNTLKFDDNNEIITVLGLYCIKIN